METFMKAYKNFSKFWEKTWIGKFIDNIINSLNNKPVGFASKKLISWTAMYTYVYVVIKWADSCFIKGWDALALGTVLGSLVGLITANSAMNVWDKKINGANKDSIEDTSLINNDNDEDTTDETQIIKS